MYPYHPSSLAAIMILKILSIQLADFYEDKRLTLKQFLVVLAMGYVLDAIPDLLEVSSGGDYLFTGGARGKTQYMSSAMGSRRGRTLFPMTVSY